MIKFELNDNLKDYDKTRYENSIDELENLESKKVFLLKDGITNFKRHNYSPYDDIKSVWLIILSDEFKIKMKGNLSFLKRTQEINFYPIFIDKFDKYMENEKYFYEIDTSLQGITSRMERIRETEKLFVKIITEFKESLYTPPVASTEWKDFIEPYEYYVDLKFELLKQDFIMLEGFDKNTKRVIFLSKENEQFKNYYTKKLYDYEYEDNRNRGLILNYDKYKSNFNNGFLKKNTYFLARKVEQFGKEEFNNVLSYGERLNNKFKMNLSKSTFFTTINKYTSEDLRNGGRIGKDDGQLDIHLAFVRDIEESYFNIDLNIMNITNSLNSLKEIEFTKCENIESINSASQKLLQINKIVDKSVNEFKKVERNINNNFKNIPDEDLGFAHESLNLIGTLGNISDYSELDLSLKNLIHNFGVETKEILNLKKIEKESLPEWDEDKLELKEDWEKEKQSKLKVINEKFVILMNEKIASYSERLKEFTIQYNHFTSINFEIIDNILQYLKTGIIRVVSYEQEINLLYNFENKNDKQEPKPNYYMLNTGDMVLVDTIKRINKKIKQGEEMNDNILNKIIQKEKFLHYFDIETKDEFFPKSYDNLNNSQKKAFRLAIDNSDPISIIQGPPGTGKTEVITNIIKYFHKKKMKTIISSQTNVAIKNVIDKLCNFDKTESSIIIPWLTTKSNEVYSKTNIDETWSEKVRSNILSSGFDFVDKWEVKSRELNRENNILQDLILSRDTMAIAATTTTSTTLPNRGYDSYLSDVKVLIIDEVSKSILPEILRYALDVEKVILVGDYKQLNPIFDIDDKKIEAEIDRSKFKDLRKQIESGIFYNLSKEAKKVNRMATLDVNYRSVPGVLDAYNVFYSGVNGDGLQSHRTIEEYSKEYTFTNSDFFDSEHSLYMINVKGAQEGKRGTSKYNKGEISALMKGLHDLANNLEDAEEKEIAVIFPYSAQINLFGQELKRKENAILKDSFKKIQYDTVDSFQGSEADIVFLSTVITDSNSRNFLSDFRRINVSMSRAKDMLVIFGNLPVLKKLEISGEGINPGRYFNEILDERKNKYLKIIDITEKGDSHD